MSIRLVSSKLMCSPRSNRPHFLSGTHLVSFRFKTRIKTTKVFISWCKVILLIAREWKPLNINTLSSWFVLACFLLPYPSKCMMLYILFYKYTHTQLTLNFFMKDLMNQMEFTAMTPPSGWMWTDIIEDKMAGSWSTFLALELHNGLSF